MCLYWSGITDAWRCVYCWIRAFLEQGAVHGRSLQHFQITIKSTNSTHSLLVQMPSTPPSTILVSLPMLMSHTLQSTPVHPDEFQNSHKPGVCGWRGGIDLEAVAVCILAARQACVCVCNPRTHPPPWSLRGNQEETSCS